MKLPMTGVGGYLFLTLMLVAQLAGAEENHQQRILPNAPDKARFELRDREWPGQPGAASVCLWKDDAVAALSITIDDNWASDHPWWLEMGQKYGLHFTWFVISGHVDGSHPIVGKWSDFAKLLKAGHDVQSHTVFHLNTADPGWKSIESEYADSVKQIEAGLPGHRVVALAYPGGKNTALNDTNVAAKYYSGCRGTAGHMNPAAQINYLNANSIGGAINLTECPWSSGNLETALNAPKKAADKWYRAWYCCHFHGVNEPERAKLDKSFAYVTQKVNEGELWVGLFREVCLYGQERDTAHLEVKESSPSRIVINLTDAMDDKLFDCPLTVKVRLPSAWTAAKALQGSKAAACRILAHDDARFALVDVIPDRGEVVVTQ